MPGAEEGSYAGREDEASCGVKGMWAVTYPLWMEVDAVVVEVTCQIEGNKWEKELGRHRWRLSALQ